MEPDTSRAAITTDTNGGWRPSGLGHEVAQSADVVAQAIDIHVPVTQLARQQREPQSQRLICGACVHANGLLDTNGQRTHRGMPESRAYSMHAVLSCRWNWLVVLQGEVLEAIERVSL